MNLDAEEDAHSAPAHVPQADLLGLEPSTGKSSFAGFGDESSGSLHYPIAAEPIALSAHKVTLSMALFARRIHHYRVISASPFLDSLHSSSTVH